MALKVVFACVVLATDIARERDGRVRLLMALEIVFAGEGLRAWAHRTMERTAVEMLVPNVVVQMIKSLASRVVERVVMRIKPLVSPINSAVTNQAPTTAILYLGKIGGDKRCGDGSARVGHLVVHDIEGCLLLARGKILGDVVDKWGTG